MFLGKQWVVKDPGEARGGNDPEGALGGVIDPWVGGRGFVNDPELGWGGVNEL